MRIVVKVDGWIYRLPGETALIEFTSSGDKYTAGSFAALDAEGNKLEVESVGLPSEISWTKRVPIKDCGALLPRDA